MQRGIYFDGWYRGHHCYHPSLPTRRLSQVREMERYRGTMAVWAAMGGGSISLPYLEQEIDGPVAPRDRFYGALTDREYVAEAAKAGVRVFGIIFEAQGWEFGCELDEDGTSVLALNELRGQGTRAEIGLREFTQDTYPALWAPFETYFPQGLVNSDGEKVTDLFDECCARALDGTPHRARWVEAPAADQHCRYMCRNNPVWREYLKAVIRLQIDGGVLGVQLDEASTPLTAIQYGCCFCKDCVKGFRAWLAALPADRLAAVTGGVPLDVATFDYREHLRSLGADPRVSKADTPLLGAYFDFMRSELTRTFTEMVDYAHEYGRAQGREVQVTSNLYNIYPYFSGVVQALDVVVSETRNHTFCQPAWYRNAVGMAQGKDLVVVENPYGGVISRLLWLLDHGKGQDAARLMSYEAAAMGGNYALPMGAWMGSVVDDSLSYPPELAVEIQSYLEHIDPLISARSSNEIAVLYDIAAANRVVLARDMFADNRRNAVDASVRAPYWECVETLAAQRLAFDAVPVVDSVVPAPHVSADDLARYRAVVLAGCTDLEEWADEVLHQVVANGGHVVVVGESSWDDPRATHVPDARAAAEHLAAYQSFQVRTGGRVGVNTHRVADDEAFVLHLVNYDIDPEEGALTPATDLEVVLPDGVTDLALTTPDAPPTRLWPRSLGDGTVRIALPAVRSHAVLTGVRTRR